jgi:hypothetical protein
MSMPTPTPDATIPVLAKHQLQHRQGQGGNGGAAAASSTAQSSASPSVTQIVIPQTAPAGGIQMTQPPQTAALSFYKIAQGQPITFGWNLTNVLITPTQLTVSAFCSANGNTYPVGPTNGVIPGDSTQVRFLFCFDE